MASAATPLFVLESNGLGAIAPILDELIDQLPANDLALFGGPKVRSQPYPAWPVVDKTDWLALDEVVRSGRWGGVPYPGPQTAAFAQEFAAMQGGGTAVPMANGSLTMEIALKAAQIGWGDEVIVPAYTFAATAAAPIAVGAIPVLVDIDPGTYCISPAAVEAAITPRTRAIMPVHLGAQMADMDAIMAIAQRHDLVVIEDCAHAHGARWQGQGAGTIGHFGSFSLQSGKTVTTGEGGVLLCRTQALADRVVSLIDCGRWPAPPRAAASTPTATPTALAGRTAGEQLAHWIGSFLGEAAPAPVGLGGNYRLTELQAALGRVGLQRFEAQRQARTEMADYLEATLGPLPGVRLLRRDRRQDRRSFYRYILALSPDRFGASHDLVCLALQAEGIPCSPGYRALHRDPRFQPLCSKLPGPSAFPECFDWQELSLSEAERASEQAALWLDESVFRAGQQGVEDALAALRKVQRYAPLLTATQAAFLKLSGLLADPASQAAQEVSYR